MGRCPSSPHHELRGIDAFTHTGAFLPTPTLCFECGDAFVKCQVTFFDLSANLVSLSVDGYSIPSFGGTDLTHRINQFTPLSFNRRFAAVADADFFGSYRRAEQQRRENKKWHRRHPYWQVVFESRRS